MIAGVILAASAAIGLVQLGQAPPGLRADEASVAYNAYCLLHTGKDWTGKPWPIFYMAAYGDYPNCLYLYSLLPVYAIGDMSIFTTRLPAALAGIASVALICYVASRMFGRSTGLTAAALLAVTPWHFAASRLAMSSSSAFVTPSILGTLALMLWAGLPIGGDHRTPRLWRSLLAGLAAGAGCYGYLGARLFLPVLVAITVVAAPARWWRLLRDRPTRWATVAFFLASILSVLPLIIVQLTDPKISARVSSAVASSGPDGVSLQPVAIALRYLLHYFPGFLFTSGDFLHPFTQGGVLYWFLLPLIVLGLIAAVAKARASAGARLLLIWLAVYPLADLLIHQNSAHLLRSLPGLPVLVMLAATGAVGAMAWLWRRRRAAAVATAVILLAAGTFFTGRFLHHQYRIMPRSDLPNAYGYTDLLEVSKWAAPRLDQYDAAFFACRFPWDQPFAYTLFAMKYPPQQWFSDSKRMAYFRGTALVSGFGKINFLINKTLQECLRPFIDDGKPHKLLLVVKNEETDLGRMIGKVCFPSGVGVLQIRELNIQEGHTMPPSAPAGGSQPSNGSATGRSD